MPKHGILTRNLLSAEHLPVSLYVLRFYKKKHKTFQKIIWFTIRIRPCSISVYFRFLIHAVACVWPSLFTMVVYFHVAVFSHIHRLCFSALSTASASAFTVNTTPAYTISQRLGQHGQSSYTTTTTSRKRRTHRLSLFQW